MRDLIDLFWLKYAQLKHAIEESDEQAVPAFDREVESLLEAIFARQASNALEIQMQFMVAIELLKKESDDSCCVLRHAENLQRVVERHIMPGSLSELASVISGNRTVFLPDRASNGDLDVTLLESLPNRVAVISADYRYLFTNSANAGALGREPADIMGGHIGEFVGLHRFIQGMRERLDRCFAGEIVDYTYADQVGDRTVVIRCRLSPYYSASAELIGALLLMEEIADRRHSSAA